MDHSSSSEAEEKFAMGGGKNHCDNVDTVK